ncbi:MAG: RNA polymerase sigma factor [Caldilineaceae bacterium]|nr:RNA polymerase sigma factor [Caldilineaceae bacterium]
MNTDTFIAEQHTLTSRLLNPQRNAGQASDQRLISRLKQGDQRAWTALLQEWQGPLFQYFSYALPDSSLAGEALTATLEAAIRAISHFDDGQSLTTFFYSLAAQRVNLLSRKRKTNKRRRIAGASQTGKIDAFHAVLATVPQNQRQALLLRYHLGLSVAEISDILGRTAAEVERMLEHGSRQLQDALGSVGYQ